jgi:hypothetical protein
MTWRTLRQAQGGKDALKVTKVRTVIQCHPELVEGCATIVLRRLAVLATCVALAACGPRAVQSNPDDPPTDAVYASNHVVTREVPMGRGIACDVWNPGEQKRTTPPSYLVADIGKAGVPRPAPNDLRTVRQIQHYVHVETLRFVYAAGEFMVYDAVYEPCAGFAPGYFVLNGGCNEYYMPASTSDFSIPVPGCLGPPRPWMPADRSRALGDASRWSHYEKTIRLRPGG